VSEAYDAVPVLSPAPDEPPDRGPRRGALPRTLSGVARLGAWSAWVTLAFAMVLLPLLHAMDRSAGFALFGWILLALLMPFATVAWVAALGSVAATAVLGLAHVLRHQRDPAVAPAVRALVVGWVGLVGGVFVVLALL
jgi:hypothetical protein